MRKEMSNKLLDFDNLIQQLNGSQTLASQPRPVMDVEIDRKRQEETKRNEEECNNYANLNRGIESFEGSHRTKRYQCQKRGFDDVNRKCNIYREILLL